MTKKSKDGFTIGSYTGNGSDSFSHYIGMTPNFTVITKKKSSSIWTTNPSNFISEPDFEEFDHEMREHYPVLEKAYQNYLNIRKLLK